MCTNALILYIKAWLCSIKALHSTLHWQAKSDQRSWTSLGFSLYSDCGENAIMQLIIFNNTAVIYGCTINYNVIQDTYKFTLIIEGTDSIVPLYYPCCERKLAPSMLYTTLVLQCSSQHTQDMPAQQAFSTLVSLSLAGKNFSNFQNSWFGGY